jgi:type II secretory pathway pseudopilin PulG
MHLHGQGRAAAEHGYTMAALLVALNIMAILMTVALPLWKTMVQREKEAELIFRGGQYVRAITLFQRKYANAYPPNIDILINEKFLRKKYKDPMTKDGEFQLVYAAQQQQRPGTAPGGGGAAGAVTTPVATPPAPLDPQTRGPAGATGGIMGVVSKSTLSGMKLFNGRTKYNEWAFTPQTMPGSRAAGAAGPGAPGAPGSTRPGPGANVPGGMPGTVRPGGFNVPGGMPQPQQPRPRPPQ